MAEGKSLTARDAVCDSFRDTRTIQPLTHRIRWPRGRCLLLNGRPRGRNPRAPTNAVRHEGRPPCPP